MNPPPFTLADYGDITRCYFIFFGMAYAGIFCAGCMASGFKCRKWQTYWGRVARLAAFLGILLLVGALFSTLWSRFIWGHFYYSTDYIGSDFIPFWPVTRGVIDAEFAGQTGRLLGISLLQLQGIWLLFASGTWAATVYLYRTIFHHKSPSPGLQAQ